MGFVEGWFQGRRISYHTFRGITVLIGAVLIHITLGVLYCFGNFSPYLVSYLRERTSSKNVRYSTASWILTLMCAGQGSCMILGGFIESRLGTRLAIFMGCCVLTTATAISHFSIHTFGTLILTYGAIFGCGIGIAYSPAMTLAIKWLPKYKGAVAGSVVAGFGLGAMVFNPIITIFINPDNKNASYAPYKSKPKEKYYHDPDDKELLDRVPNCFFVMAGFFVVLQAVGNLLLKAPPQPQTEYEDFYETTRSRDNLIVNKGEDASVQSSRKSSGTRSAIVLADCRPIEIIKMRQFWCFWIGFLCNIQGINYCTLMWKEFGQEFIDNDLFLAGVGSAGSLANAFSRIFWGSLGDKIGFKPTMLILQTTFTVLYFVFYYTQYLTQWGYAIFIFLMFFCIGGSFAIFPTATVKEFGITHSTSNYGLVFTASICAAFLNLATMNLVEPNISEQYMQWLTAAFLLIGLINTALFKSRYRSNTNSTTIDSGYQTIGQTDSSS